MRKEKNEKRRRNPMIDFADAVNRSVVGDPGALANGGCLSIIITLVIFVIGLLILSRCSY